MTTTLSRANTAGSINNDNNHNGNGIGGDLEAQKSQRLRRGNGNSGDNDGPATLEPDMDDLVPSAVQKMLPKNVTPLYLVVFRKMVAEVCGTFFLVSTIGLSGGQGEALAALAIGASLWASIFAFGHVSGGHFNPAVTLGVYLRGAIPIVDALLYVVAQLIGAFLGAVFSNEDLGAPCMMANSTVNLCGAGYPNVAPGYRGTIGVPFSMEFVWTFFLVTVVLNVATTKAQEGNSFFGFAIGSVVFCGAVSVGGISGGAFNPAVGTALPVIAGDTSFVWLYWLAPMLGGEFRVSRTT